MFDAYLYDHVRTPRGKGKKDGGLHQASPVWMLRTLLQPLQQRAQLDTSRVDDVVLGCVTPLGEQGAEAGRHGHSMSILNEALAAPLRFPADLLEDKAAGLTDLILRSGKRDFLAGADIDRLRALETAQQALQWMGEGSGHHRRTGTVQRPDERARAGRALAGGCEPAGSANTDRPADVCAGQ